MPPETRKLRSSRAAQALVAVGLVEVAIALAGSFAAGGTSFDIVDSYVLSNLAVGCGGFALCGVLIAVRRPELPIGWLFIAGSLAQLTAAAVGPWAYVIDGWPSKLLATLFNLTWPAGLMLFLPIAILWFPDGRLPDARWRWAVWFQALAWVAWVVRSELDPTPRGIPERPSFFALSTYDQHAALWHAIHLLDLGTITYVSVLLLVRWLDGDDVVRQQLLYIVTGFTIALVVNWQFILTATGPAILNLAYDLIAWGVAVAILRHRMLDIRLVVSRSVVYLALTGLVIAGFIGIVALSDLVLRRESEVAPIAAAVIVALAFNPARVFLQRQVERLVYGARKDPVRAMSAVASGLASTDLHKVVDTLRDTLRLPYVAIRTDRSAIESGAEPPASVAVELPGLGMESLVVGLRAGERHLSAADASVLRLVAGPLSAAVRASELSADLRESRERLFMAREEERRRIRRDLHDGLGPSLTGFALTVDGVSNLLDSDPSLAREVLARLRDEMTRSIEDVRQLVYGLRPPSLDDLGLVGAVRAQAARLDRRADGTAITVCIESPPQLPDLPAAVEVAAYRIATEALTNVARHSSALHATVAIAAAEDLEITVSDDGDSLGPWSAGVGLHSMSERAQEVGGVLSAGPTPQGGVVCARMPISHTPAPVH